MTTPPNPDDEPELAPPPPDVNRDAATCAEGLEPGPAPPPPEVDRNAMTLGGLAPAPPEVDRNAMTLGGLAPAPPEVDRDALTFAGGIPNMDGLEGTTHVGGLAPPAPPVDRDAATFDGSVPMIEAPFDASARTLEGTNPEGLAPLPPPVDREAATFDGSVPVIEAPFDASARTLDEGTTHLDVDRGAATAPTMPSVPFDSSARTLAEGTSPGVDRAAPTFKGSPPDVEGPMVAPTFDAGARTLDSTPGNIHDSLNQSGPIPMPNFESTFTDSHDKRDARTLSESSASSHPNAFDSRDAVYGSQPEPAWNQSSVVQPQQTGETTRHVPAPTPPADDPGSEAQTRADRATHAEGSQPPAAVGPGDTHVEPRSQIDAGSQLVQSQATIPRGKPGSAIPSRLGPYRLKKALGAGGMGAVYQAVHTRTERSIALKVLRVPPGAETGVQRFLVEGRAAGRLAHPNLVSVLDLAQDERSGLWYMAMELVEGETLYDLVQRDGTLSDQRAAELGVALGEALSYAHEQKVLHRDVKPHNVMIDQQGTFKLTDFGLAKLLEEDDQGLTQGFTLLGTPGYMAPEQAGMAAPVDGRADVYGVGATLYYALGKRAPFTGKTVGSVIHQVLSKNPPPLRKAHPEVPVDLETIVLHSLEKEVEHRYPSMRDLVEDLKRYQASTKIVATRPSGPEQLRRWIRRNPKPAALTALALVCVLMGLTYGMLAFVNRARDQAEIERQKEQVAEKEQEVEEQKQEVEQGKQDLEEQKQEVQQEIEKLDEIAPTLELRQPDIAEGQTLRTRDDAIPLEVRVQDRDVAGVFLNGTPLEADPAEEGVYRGSWALPSDGRHEALLEAKDEAGNVSPFALAAVRDTAPPRVEVTITPTKYPEGDPGAVREVTVRVTIQDEEQPPASLKVRKQGAGDVWLPEPLPFSSDEAAPWVREWTNVELVSDGKFTFTATVADDVGNVGEAKDLVERKALKVVEEDAWWRPTGSQIQFAKDRNLPLSKTVGGIDFVLIPPGVFSRGAGEEDPYRKPKGDDARPHQVRLTKGFYLSAWEVSQEQYAALVPGYSAPTREFPVDEKLGRLESKTVSLANPKWPVVGVSRVDAVAWCAKFGNAAGEPGRVRLPTEAEWEYACRAETTGPWFWGPVVAYAKDYANVKDDKYVGELEPELDQRGLEYFSCNDGHVLFAAVRREGVKPNPFGLFDTIGNACEWVADDFKLYPRDRSVELTNPFHSGGRAGVQRGGTCFTQLQATRSTSRRTQNPAKARESVGFRILLELEAE